MKRGIHLLIVEYGVNSATGLSVVGEKRFVRLAEWVLVSIKNAATAAASQKQEAPRRGMHEVRQ